MFLIRNNIFYKIPIPNPLLEIDYLSQSLCNGPYIGFIFLLVYMEYRLYLCFPITRYVEKVWLLRVEERYKTRMLLG